MRSGHQCCMAYFILASLFTAVGSAGVEPAVQIELERKCVEQRKRITSGHVDFDIRTAVHDAKTRELLDVNKSGLNHEFDYLWDGDKRRLDERSRGTAVSPDGRIILPANGMIEHRIILTPEEFAYRNATSFVDEAPIAAQTGPRSRGKQFESKFFDIRILGMIPLSFGLLHHHGFEDFYEYADRYDCELEQATLDGREVIRSIYRRKKDEKLVTLWICPELDHSVVQAEFTTAISSPEVRTHRIHSRFEKRDSDFWFPVECEFTFHRNGTLAGHELCKVSKAEFNIAVDPVSFTLAGLELPAGSFVVELTNSKKEAEPTPTENQPNPPVANTKVWDGKELVMPSTSAPNPSENPIEKRSGWVWFQMFHGVAGLGLLCLYAWLRYRRVRTKLKNSA